MFKYLLTKSRIEKKTEKGKLELQEEKFKSILKFAQSVLDTTENHNTYKRHYSKGNEHPILDVIRFVGRPTQTKCLTSLLYHEDESDLDLTKMFLDNTTSVASDGKRIYNLKKEVKTTKEVRLNKDLIFPLPWKRRRLISAISYIGEGRPWGQWKNDNRNHFVELWLPLGITWVNNGNHSIAAGILQGVGTTIKPECTYDVSEFYKYIYTDGRYYIRKEDNLIIAPVEDVEFAAIFEIGRLMVKNSISF